MKKSLLLPCLFLLSICNSFAQSFSVQRPDGKTISTSQVDAIVKKLMDTADVPGLQLGIINSNKLSYVKSYGFKDKAKNELNDTSTTFYAASLSKSLFAYIVM